MALGHAHHRDQRLLQIAGAIGSADDDGGASVALQAAVEQPEGIGDHARGMMLLDGEWLVHHHVAVEDGVLARHHGDLGEVPCGGAVELHVAARALGIELGRREHADRRLELRRQGELRELLQARRDARTGIAGAADRDQHVLAHTGGHGHRRGLDGGDAGGAAHRHEHREREIGQAEIGDKILGDAAAREVGDHAVDVARAQAGIGDGGQARLELQRQRAFGRAARIGGLANAADRRLLSKRHAPCLFLPRPSCPSPGETGSAKRRRLRRGEECRTKNWSR